MSKRFQLGEFWLEQRSESPVWYIAWCERRGKGERGRTKRHSTGERDFERAQVKLAEHYLTHAKLKEEQPSDVTIAFVLDRYYEKHASKLASRASAASAIANWKAFWGQSTVAELTLDRQNEFEQWLRKRTYKRAGDEIPLSGGTVARQWNVGPTALEWARKAHEIKYYPAIRFLSDGTRRKRVLTLQEAAALFNAAAETEHLWRWLILAFATAARPNAPLEIRPKPPMVDLENRCIDLLPPGRQQNPKKRRPIIPICATLLPWLRLWTADEALIYRKRRRRGGELTEIVRVDRLIAYRGKRIVRIKSGFENLKERAGITDPTVVPYTIRHTMTTWFMRQRVAEWDREVWLGHKEPGSKTTAGYIHLSPDYLSSARDAVDAYFAELAPLVKRPISLRASCAPVPGSASS